MTKKVQRYGALLKEKHVLNLKLMKKEQHITNLKMRIAEAMDDIENFRDAAAVFYDGIIAELSEQMKEMENRETELQKRLMELTSLETRERGSLYKTEIRLTYYHLLTLGVSANNIEPVIRAVLNNLSPVDMKNVKLPKRTTAQRMRIEAGVLATVRGLVELDKRDDTSVAYYSDKSPKAQLEWLTHKFTLSPTQDERLTGSRTTFSIGIRPIAGGKAQDTLDDLISHIDDLQRIATDLGIKNPADVVSLCNIKAKMSDRAATETKLTSLLIEAKTRELESKLTNWHSLTNVERERMTRVYAFTCGAHKVPNTSEAMNKAAIDHLYTSDELSSRGLIGAKKHIYEADKLLCTEARKEYSEGKDFRAYCLTEEKVAESACGLFRPIIGSRYLVYFHCSIPTFIGQEFIQTFLINEREAKSSWNRLEKAVYDGYFDDRILAEERTYGILYTEVLLPLLTKCKVASDPLAMNECYTTAVTKLRQWSEEPELIFNENDHIWPDVTLHYPEYMQKIREKYPTDDLVIELLKVCCKAGAQKLKDHATEHLPGGLYGDPSLEQHKAASLIPTATNDTCESDFGMLSQQHKFAPSSNPLSLGAIVMAKRDHSAEWAMKQDKEDRKKVVSAARMEAIRAMKKYGTRDKQLSTIFRQKEARKQVQRERRRAALLKKSQKKSQMKDALQDGQLIDCISEIKTASSKVCNIQIHMWAQLEEFGVEVHSKEKLVGRSKITTVDSKRKLLIDLVKANPLINASIKCAMSSNESSSSDDDDDDEDLIIDLQPLSKLRAQMDMHH